MLHRASGASCGAGKSAEYAQSDRREERRMPSRDDGSAGTKASRAERRLTWAGPPSSARSPSLVIVVRCGLVWCLAEAEAAADEGLKKVSGQPVWQTRGSSAAVPETVLEHGTHADTCIRYSYIYATGAVVRTSKVGITPRQRPTHLRSSHRHPSSGSACTRTYSVNESAQRTRGTPTGEQTALQPRQSHTV